MPRGRPRRNVASTVQAAKAKMRLKRKAAVYSPKFNVIKHHFKRGADIITYTGAGTYVSGGWGFQLSSVINSAEFTALFDMYRINAIGIAFHYRLDPGAATYGNGASYPRMYSVKDYDDTTAPTTINELREYSKCKLNYLNPNKPLRFKLRPAVQSSVGVNKTPKWKQWLDCSTPGTEHMGFKWIIDNLPTNAVLEVDIKYYVSFKDAK